MDKTYYDEINAQTRSLVVWLDHLIDNPNYIIKMNHHHIHLIEMRACMTKPYPIHKDKKISKWITDKMYDVVKIHRIHEMELEETRFYLEQVQKKFKDI